MAPVDMGVFQLGLCLLFVLVTGICSLLLKLDLERELLWGTVRTFGQLYLMGYLLRFLFAVDSMWLVLSVFSGMIGFAAWIIRGRVRERSVSFFRSTLLSMLVSYMAVTVVVTAVIVQVNPWYLPRYFIPLGGMVIGNSMNAVALSLERLFSELRTRRDQVEMMLSLGADYREATGSMFRSAVGAGMIPSINAMMGVGVVFVPGMMTGQILAGADPLLAVKYQIVVMLMLTSSTAMGSILVVSLVRKKCFTAAQQLRLGLPSPRSGLSER